MKVGDLIIDPDTGDVGILVDIDHSPERHNSMGKLEPYRILGPEGRAYWFEVDYIENECEVLSESR